MTGSAILKLYRSGVEAVLATDTLDKGVSTVSVAPLIAKALKMIVSGLDNFSRGLIGKLDQSRVYN